MTFLFEIKRALCEVMDIVAKRIIINKINKKVLYVNGSDLQFVSILMPTGIVNPEANVDQRVQDRYKEFITIIYGQRCSS